MSPKLESWMLFVIFEFMTTVPKPTVSYMSFIYIPCEQALMLSNFFFYLFSKIS